MALSSKQQRREGRQKAKSLRPFAGRSALLSTSNAKWTLLCVRKKKEKKKKRFQDILKLG